MRVHGQVAVVTGAARGIGRAIATRLHQEGARVFLLDRDHEGLATTVRALGGESVGVDCDVSDPASVASAVDQVLSQQPPPTILVNNAGINPSPAPITDTPPQAWEAVLGTNLGGPYLVSRALIPHLPPGSSIVHVASLLALVGVRSCSAYTASKGGLVALTRSMAADHAPHIRVNCVCPGAIRTEMLEEYLGRCDDPEAERRRIVEGIPLGRLGRAEDVANAVLFLASPESAWITGQLLVVDGGDAL